MRTEDILIYGIKLTDALSIFASIFTIIAVFIAIKQLREQRKIAATQLILTLDTSLREQWNAYKNSNNDSEKEFFIVGILNTLEAACATYNEGAATGKLNDFLKLYIKDNLRHINLSNIDGFINKYKGEEENFKEISVFRRKNLLI